jgi:hypothetical protein
VFTIILSKPGTRKELSEEEADTVEAVEAACTKAGRISKAKKAVNKKVFKTLFPLFAKFISKAPPG